LHGQNKYQLQFWNIRQGQRTEQRIENEYSVPKDEVWGAISLMEMSLLDIHTFIQEISDYYKEGENGHNDDE